MRLNACIEDLKDMTPTENGKHCHSCNKTIVDLTEKTNEEINQLYLDNNGDLCGILLPNQLNENKYYHPLKRFAFALMLVFGSALFVFGNDVKLQFDTFRFKVLQEVEVINSENTIKGFVYAEGKAINNAEIIVYDQDKIYKARTNELGEFILELPNLNITEVTLYLGAEGFHPMSKNITLSSKSIFIGKITLTKIDDQQLVNGKVAPDKMKTAGVVVCPKPPEVEKTKGEVINEPRGKIKYQDSIFD